MTPIAVRSQQITFLRHIERELAPEGIEIRRANGNVGELRLAVWYQGSSGQPVHVVVQSATFAKTDAEQIANSIRTALKDGAVRQ